jgi:hypothetical protein
MLNARFEEEERPPEPDLVRRESHKDTELYFECEDVDEVYVHLCEQGVEAIAPKSTHGRKEILITDPDGFCLSFYQGT